MTDDRLDKRFDDLMRDASQTYRRPPEPPLDEMWASIEAQLPAHGRITSISPMRESRNPFRYVNWVAAAATLVIGIGIGRGSALLNPQQPVAARQVVARATAET